MSKVLTKEIAQEFLADEDSHDLYEFEAIDDAAADPSANIRVKLMVKIPRNGLKNSKRIDRHNSLSSKFVFSLLHGTIPTPIWAK